MEDRRKKFDELLDLLSRVQRSKKELHEELYSNELPLVREIHIVDFYSRLYVPVVFLSDLHLSSIYSNAERLKEILSFVKERNVKIILLGDFFDFSMSMGIEDLIIDDVLTDEEQFYIFKKFIEDYKDHILVVVFGNHEKKMYRFLASLLNEIEIPYAYNKAIILLKIFSEIGETTYKIYLAHKPRYYSSINPFHIFMRIRQLECHDADLYVTGHYHTACYAYIHNSFFISLGSLKKGDIYSRQFEKPNINQTYDDFFIAFFSKFSYIREIQVFTLERFKSIPLIRL